MTFYAIIRNGVLLDIQKNCQSKTEGDINIETTEEVFQTSQKYGYNYYKWNGTTLIKNPKYEEELSAKRKELFCNNFFKIEGYGYFRKSPKGYSSAVESINTAFNMVTVMGTLPAGTLTFYTEPDFSDESQCTEEWLVANQVSNVTMTAQEFGTFYAQFMTSWNNQEHK